MSTSALQTWPPPGMLGFPPGTHYVVLPGRPRQAALSGLALYDATLPHQRIAAVGARLAVRLGLGRLLRVRRPPPLPPVEWWQGWIEEVAGPLVGPVAASAFRLSMGDGASSKVTALLLDAEGMPLAFAKLPSKERPTPATLQFLAALADSPPKTFTVPRLLGSGVYAGRKYMIQQAMPPGSHRRLRHDAGLVEAIIAELQRTLDAVPKPNGTPPGWVAVHGDLLPLNLRRGGDGRIWLFDWDRAGWGPRLGDALVYWIGDLARRRGPRRSRRLIGLLRRLGDDSEIRAALTWRKTQRPEEGLPGEQELREAVEEAVTA